MTPIPFSQAQLSADEALKQKAALQQMQDLLERIAVGKKHRTLTRSDRRTLSQEGYAQDLVDNLVLITQRIPNAGIDGKKYLDQVQTGFTYAAFDPSLYANTNTTRHLRSTHQGCCAFCESFLESSGSGSVVSFRPPSVVFENNTTVRSPYWPQAYAAKNLYFACPACAENHKSAYFPVQGNRKANADDEQALLLAPYDDQPRDFIRFNPVNGRAFAFDRVSAFYQASQNSNEETTQALLWRDPSSIPLQTDQGGKALSSASLDQAYITWLANHADSYPRGQASIDVFGLNRHALVVSRRIQAESLRNLFQTALPRTDDPSALSTYVQTLLAQQLQYHSLNLDVIQTCLAQLNATQGQATNSPNISNSPASAPPAADAVVNPPSLSALSPQSNPWPQAGFPTWLISSLMYMMFENELHINDKRRLVNLSADDTTYGADNPEKSLFIPVDWWRDANKVIKVKSKNHIWETSFQELAASRPLEVRSLFANNHLWVEGDFPALI